MGRYKEAAVPGKGIDPDDIRFFSGSSNPALAAAIASHLGVPLDPTGIRRYSNDCMAIQLGASVRSRRVFIVQSLSPPVNDHLMELLMMLDAARGAAACEVHALIPYLSFARSDKKDAPRISITARLVADLLETAGATHVMTMVLHSPQVHGFFGIPADPLTSRPVFREYFKTLDLSGTIVVSPDAGHADSAGRFAHDLGLPVTAGTKQRVSDTEVKIEIVGRQAKGFTRALVYDDEISTGGSVAAMCEILIAQGVKEIWVVGTHGVFVKNGLERLAAIPQVTKIAVTDTVHIPPERRHPKLVVLSVAPIFGEAIRCNFMRRSISDLFVYGENEGN
jgi:ribose-phosphate pyrophosphokinase